MQAAEDHKTRRARHVEMEALCQVWATSNGHKPGADYKHLAPDGATVKLASGEDATIDFAQFYYGIPPWHVGVADAHLKTVNDVINAAGVPPNCSDESANAAAATEPAKGWTCTREGCGEWVDMAPRQARGEEPYNWWYCFKCKKLPRPSKRELDRMREAKKYRKIDKMFG